MGSSVTVSMDVVETSGSSVVTLHVVVALQQFVVNVGVVGAKFDTPEYQKFLADWRTRVDRIKKRPPPKMP